MFGIFLIMYAAYKLVIDFSSFARLQTLTDFSLPPIMTLLFLPFLFIVSLYVNYENAFARLRFAINDPSLRFYAKRRALVAFHVRTALLKRWARNLAISSPQGRQDVDKAIREVKRIRERERQPDGVPFERGWSPFTATAFLATEGPTGDYHRAVGEDDEWWASSQCLEIGDAIMPNNLAYYVDGSETAATALKLVLNVNEPETAQDARRKLLEAASILYEKALGDQMPKEFANHLAAGSDLVAQLRGKEVAVSKELWPSHRTGGHSIKFLIRNIPDPQPA